MCIDVIKRFTLRGYSSRALREVILVGSALVSVVLAWFPTALKQSHSTLRECCEM